MERSETTGLESRQGERGTEMKMIYEGVEEIGEKPSLYSGEESRCMICHRFIEEKESAWWVYVNALASDMPVCQECWPRVRIDKGRVNTGEIEMRNSKDKRAGHDTNAWDSVGCLFIAIGIAIVIWAMSGFPRIW